MKFAPILFAILTAIFWGTYGPTLAESRVFLKSPFKPYVAIGLAYLVWGIGGGVLGMLYKGDNFSFTGPGAMWGLAAGSLGAFGAFTLTLAMYSGGKPHLVMPIVFGGAVTVAALVSLWKESEHATAHPMLWAGILGIVICAAIVAYYTPHAAPPAAPAPATGTPATGAGNPGGH
jgi:hypothetical protein